MKYDPLEKTTRIPFKVVEGRLVHFYDGQPINELREGCSGDIVIENFKITDKSRIKEYNTEARVPFLPSRTKLLARVNESHVPTNLRRALSEEKALIGGARVEIILEDELSLLLRGTKLAKLGDCKCYVPALNGLLTENKQPSSVSQAYTRITEHFEPHRVSAGGSVFNCVYYNDVNLGWQPLRVLRERLQTQELYSNRSFAMQGIDRYRSALSIALRVAKNTQSYLTLCKENLIFFKQKEPSAWSMLHLVEPKPDL